MKGKLKELYDRANQSGTVDTSVNGDEREYADEASARRAFSDLREKLLRIEHWNYESALTSFARFSSNGRQASGEKVAAGDFIRISLKGSGKYDWVKVAEVADADDEAIVTVRPSPDPTDEERDEKSISHFFASEAKNNFCLQRDGKTIYCYVIGLDEKTNLGETDNILETARNAAVANLGYFFGVQKGEWKTFCRNFLYSDAGN